MTTVRTRRVLRAAADIAQGSNSKYIWEVHLLYAMTVLEGAAKEALALLGITTEVVAEFLPKPSPVPVKRVGFHPRVLKLIPSVIASMEDLDNSLVSPGHFVLAMIKDENRAIVEVCMKLRVSLNRVEAAVHLALAQELDADFEAMLKKAHEENP